MRAMASAISGPTESTRTLPVSRMCCGCRMVSVTTSSCSGEARRRSASSASVQRTLASFSPRTSCSIARKLRSSARVSRRENSRSVRPARPVPSPPAGGRGPRRPDATCSGAAATGALRAVAAHLDELRLAAWEELAAASLRVGDAPGLVAELTALAAAHPLYPTLKEVPR